MAHPTVTYGDALERAGLTPKLPKYPPGMYQTVCSKCDLRTRCAASKFHETMLTVMVPNIQKSGFCRSYTRGGYNPSGYYGFRNGHVA